MSLPVIDWISCIAITSDARFIVSGSGDKSIKIFDLESKEPVHHFKDAHTGIIF